VPLRVDHVYHIIRSKKNRNEISYDTTLRNNPMQTTDGEPTLLQPQLQLLDSSGDTTPDSQSMLKDAGYAYATYYFTKQEPVANCYRFYQLTYQPGLWSQHCLQRTWGRIGSMRPSNLCEEFEDAEAARKALKVSVSRRLKRGYNVACSPSHHPPGSSVTCACCNP